MKNLILQQIEIVKNGVANIIFPPFCPLCENELRNNERLICEDCYSLIKTIESPFCRKCGVPLNKKRKTCKFCKTGNFHFTKVRAFGTFTYPLSEMIHFLKYERKTLIADRLGIFLGNLLLSTPELSQADIILPVPLHRTRIRERGYNQSLLLAKMVSSNSGKPLCLDAVFRTKPTKSQTKLDQNERRENLKDAFTVVFPERIKNCSIVVVDDVFTTGTTLDEIAKTLLKAGADCIYGLVLARTLTL